MSKRINSAKLFFVFGLILTTLNCGFAPESECELTEADCKSILGMNVKAIDENDAAFGGAANSKNVRACGYVFKKPTKSGYLYWVQGKSEDEQEAKRMFEMSGNKSPEASNYSAEEIPRLGDEARLIRYETANSKELKFYVRKGKSVSLITVSKTSASEIPVEQVKSLAERIAAKTTDY